MKNKHLSVSDRFEIEKSLNNNLSFKKIGILLNKNCTTISREIRHHYIVKNSGAVGRKFNNCLFRKSCPDRGSTCNIQNCTEFVKERCKKLSKPGTI